MIRFGVPGAAMAANRVVRAPSGASKGAVRHDDLVRDALAQLREAALLREPDDGLARAAVEAAARGLGVEAIDASSNDYLGLARGAVSRETTGAPGAAASRLIYGTTGEHLRLEEELARWVHKENALLFSSAYAANLGLLSALGSRETIVVSDAANHASLIDGARLGRAEVRVVAHLDLAAVREAVSKARQARACWVVVESYFSMDGDGPDLAALRELCDEHDACLIVDEAHALGVFGPHGAGRCAESGIAPDILSGALGKAVGTSGGFVAGSGLLRTFLWNKARSFVFSTAPSPRHAALTSAQLALARNAEQERTQLAVNAAALRGELQAAGLPLTEGSFGPIISVLLGDNRKVLAVAARLRGVGILAQAIRPPTVPVGGARLRLTVKATFSADDLLRLSREVVEACRAS